MKEQEDKEVKELLTSQESGDFELQHSVPRQLQIDALPHLPRISVNKNSQEALSGPRAFGSQLSGTDIPIFSLRAGLGKADEDADEHTGESAQEMLAVGRKNLTPISPMAGRSRLSPNGGEGSPRSKTSPGRGAASEPPSPQVSHCRTFNDLEEGEDDETAGRRKGQVAAPESAYKALTYMFLWFFFSTCLSLYNKFLIGAKHGSFPAPLLMTSIHFSMQWAISAFLLNCVCTSWAPTTKLSWRDYIVRVVPTALTTATDIGVSNLSLAFISLTFYTMCKSSAPVFLLIFAFAFKLEVPSLKLLGVIIIICIGLLFTVAGETEFELAGFILVMLGALMSGLRWVLVQVLLQKEKLGLTNPLVTLYYLTPVMLGACALFSLGLESWHKLDQSVYFDSPRHIASSIGLMALGGSFAFFMIMTEFLLISETSALTFTVAGTVKEGLTILVSHFVFKDTFTGVNATGLLIISLGVILFNVYKYFKRLEEAGSSASDEKDMLPEEELLVQPRGPASASSAPASHSVLPPAVLGVLAEPRPPSPKGSSTSRYSTQRVLEVVRGGGMQGLSGPLATDGGPWRSPRGLASPGSQGLHERHVEEFVLQDRRV